jgi:hypothetical protein
MGQSSLHSPPITEGFACWSVVFGYTLPAPVCIPRKGVHLRRKPGACESAALSGLRAQLSCGVEQLVQAQQRCQQAMPV